MCFECQRKPGMLADLDVTTAYKGCTILLFRSKGFPLVGTILIAYVNFKCLVRALFESLLFILVPR